MHCEIFCHSASHHLQQLFTGLFILKQKGFLDYSQTLLSPEEIEGRFGIGKLKRETAILVLNGTLRLFYDIHDGPEINADAVEHAECYFKRSLDPQALGHCPDPGKVHPYGLYYNVYPQGIDLEGAVRYFWYGKGMEKVRRISLSMRLHPLISRVSLLEALPDPHLEPKVLFMTGAWDPDTGVVNTPESREFRSWINRTRAECISMLRREFGERFYGGFIPSAYARREYPELLVPIPSSSSKANYLRLVKQHAVCMATAGLHGSIGGKFAEYIAMSRAIVSQTVRHLLPGGCERGKNYLEFDDPRDCVPLASELVLNKTLRGEMMADNYRYYQAYLRPDSLVLNTLLTATRQAASAECAAS
jgi:hypothetical protein